jgi:hypothetical protein
VLGEDSWVLAAVAAAGHHDEYRANFSLILFGSAALGLRQTLPTAATVYAAFVFCVLCFGFLGLWGIEANRLGPTERATGNLGNFYRKFIAFGLGLSHSSLATRLIITFDLTAVLEMSTGGYNAPHPPAMGSRYDHRRASGSMGSIYDVSFHAVKRCSTHTYMTKNLFPR